MGDAAQAQLVERSRRGDAAAFAALVDSLERVALAVAFGITGDSAAAGDVVQDAFLRAWQRLDDLKEPGKFGPWLCGIVRNLAIDVTRAQAVRLGAHGGADRTEAAEATVAPPGGSPLDELRRREDRQRVTTAVDKLDDLTRSVVVLRYYENCSSRQIGELLGMAPTAVDMRLMRARRQLREHLKTGDENDDDDHHGRRRPPPHETFVRDARAEGAL